MHKNSRRGKSHSIRPSSVTANWITYSQQEIELIIEGACKERIYSISNRYGFKGSIWNTLG